MLRKKKTLLAFSQVYEDCILWRLKFSYTDQMAEVSKSVMQFFNSGLNLKKTICSEILTAFFMVENCLPEC